MLRSVLAVCDWNAIPPRHAVRASENAPRDPRLLLFDKRSGRCQNVFAPAKPSADRIFDQRPPEELRALRPPPGNGVRGFPPTQGGAAPRLRAIRSRAAAWRRKEAFAGLSEFSRECGARRAKNPCRASDRLHRARESSQISKSSRAVRANRADVPVSR